ncbi:helix-turn-helix domain-containing protein [Lacinutrix chionoecetis]
MKNVTTLNTFPKQIFRLKELLGGIITEDYGIYKLEFNNTFGNGTIKHYPLRDGNSVLDFDIIVKQDLVFKIGDNETNLLYFAYCTEGMCYFKSALNEKYNRIEELRPSVIGCFKEDSNQLNIKKDKKFVFNLIAIDKDNYFNRFSNNEDENSGQLKNLLKSFEILNSRLFQCTYNLKISDCLRVASTTSLDCLVSNILKIESSHQKVLALHINQFFKEVNEEVSSATLSKSELQKVRQLTDYITEYPEVQHSIASLCGKISMSPAKLQEGFKSMHDTTVADFVRNVRIEKAEKLLLETDLNISEIVYTIGLTSRSYFCKIFKKKYDCSPKRYRKIIRASTNTNFQSQIV